MEHDRQGRDSASIEGDKKTLALPKLEPDDPRRQTAQPKSIPN